MHRVEDGAKRYRDHGVAGEDHKRENHVYPRLFGKARHVAGRRGHASICECARDYERRPEEFWDPRPARWFGDWGLGLAAEGVKNRLHIWVEPACFII